jgi:hypothetical protein
MPLLSGSRPEYLGRLMYFCVGSFDKTDKKNKELGSFGSKTVLLWTLSNNGDKILAGGKMKKYLFTAIAIVALALLPGCPPGPDPHKEDVPTAAQHVEQGIEYLKTKDFSAARTEFHAAADMDPANVDAKVWKAFLDLANISVDSDVVSLFRDDMGFTGYPSDLNKVLSDSWFTKQYYFPRDGFSAVTSTTGYEVIYLRGNLTAGSDYVSCYRFSDGEGADAPSGAWTFDDGGSYVVEFLKDKVGTDYTCTAIGGATLKLSSYSSSTKYVSWFLFADISEPFAIHLPVVKTPPCAPKLAANDSLPALALKVVLNLATATTTNPTGMNGLIDKVMSGCYGSEFDSVVAAIESLGAGDSVVVPEELIEAYDGEAPEFTIAINRDELLLFAAQMRLMKSIAQYASSYSYSYPLGAFLLDPGDPALQKDEDGDGIPDAAESIMTAAKSPLDLTSGFLGDRSQASRNESKTSILAAMSDLRTAAMSISTELKKPNNGAYSDYDIPPNAVTAITAGIDKYAPEVLALHDAIQNGTTYSFSMEAGEDTINVVIDPAKLYASAVFRPDNLIEYSGDIPVPYTYATFSGGEWSGVASYAIGSGKTGVHGGFQLKVKMSTIESLWTNYQADFSSDFGTQLYIPLGPPSSNPDPYNSFLYPVYKWFLGFTP